VQRLKKVKKWLIKNVADIRLYKGGIILFGDSHYRMKGEDVRAVLDVVRRGDVLLRRYDHYLGSHLTPGYYSHAALYMGDNRVTHMLGEGICEEDILTFCRTDAVCILRHEDDYDKYFATKKAAEWLKKGVQYDYEFEGGDEEFYCTEFVWECFGKPQELLFDKYLLPDDFLECPLFTMVLRRPHSVNHTKS
jgi:hypothetical protein